MIAFVIEQNGQIKEAFGYEIPLNQASQQALVEYARANYGSDATLRQMTDIEKAMFEKRGRDFFKAQRNP
jgi:hypothetical protein